MKSVFTTAQPTLHRSYAGLRVVDLSQGVAAPYCAQVLQQLGADVVKFEPLKGDWSRAMGTTRAGMSALTMAFNRGKLSLACDAQKPEGRAILTELVSNADVVVQSFRPGVVEKLGAGYDEVSACNPGVVYVSISGFGPSGPYAARPATDSIVQALAGMAYTNSTPDGTPVALRPYAADLASGLYAANAVGAALFARERSASRVGQHLDISLLACLAAWQNCLLIEQSWLGGGSATVSAAVPQGFFRTLDGHVALVALNDRMFSSFAKAIGRTDWAADPTLQTAVGRQTRRGLLLSEIDALLRVHPSKFWLARFEEADVLAAEVKPLSELPNDPQVRHLELLQPMPAPGDHGATIDFAGLPGIAPGARSADECTPAIGEHSAQILRTLGYDEVAIARLVAAGTIGIADDPF